MSRVSYCSLEEAWGKSNIENNNYEKLQNKSKDMRDEVINNMNNMERNSPSNHPSSTSSNSLVEYNKYRFNPYNNVEHENVNNTYSPFQENIEKKYLKDKLIYLENELLKYKNVFEPSYIEKFSNPSSQPINNNNNTNDIFDIVLLIIIGLILILFMNSIFNLGKTIGSKK
jgi:hypothetical protein